MIVTTRRYKLRPFSGDFALQSDKHNGKQNWLTGDECKPAAHARLLKGGSFESASNDLNLENIV